MEFGEWWTAHEQVSRHYRNEITKTIAQRAWQAAQAEQRERDARIAEEDCPSCYHPTRRTCDCICHSIAAKIGGE